MPQKSREDCFSFLENCMPQECQECLFGARHCAQLWGFPVNKTDVDSGCLKELTEKQGDQEREQMEGK